MEQVLITRRFITEYEIPSRPLGRHVYHDSRSRLFPVEEAKAATIKSVRWTRQVPVFDQGNIGSCTGNAAAGALGTDPFYATMPNGLTIDEALAIRIYSLATELDPYPGQYPPDDTGSNGLSAAKACQKKLNLISGYKHAFSLNGILSGLQSGPMIIGTNWYESFDHPNTNNNGLVGLSGSVRGGHEYECVGVDVEDRLFYFYNPWTAQWGMAGMFCYSYEVMDQLLSEEGDAVLFVPLTQAPPQPIVIDGSDAALVAAMDPWAATVTSTDTLAGKAKTEYETWRGRVTAS